MQADGPFSAPFVTHAPLVYISILNWRDPRQVAVCVKALLDLDYPRYCIIVVNNGSKSDLVACLAPWEDRITVIHNAANLGFCGGNNVAMRRAIADGADFIWLFNSDAFSERDTLSRLVAVMLDDPRIGLASPVLYHDEHRSVVWNAGGWFDLQQCDWGWFVDVEEATQFEKISAGRFMLPGTALLVRARMMRIIGGLAEDFFAYHEDTDYSVRAERAGFKRRLVTDASAYHDHPVGAGPSPHACYYNSRNETLLWRKYSPIRVALRRRLWSLATALAASRNQSASPQVQMAYITGWWHGQVGVTGEWNPKRRIPGWLARLITSRWVAAKLASQGK